MISKKIDIIGVPLDDGVAIKGASLGPKALRLNNLVLELKRMGVSCEDLGDIVADSISSKNLEEENGLKNLSLIKECCLDLKRKIFQSLKHNSFPLCLGGDHSVAMGSVAGVKKYCHENNKKLGIIWFDAHADMNTHETSPSGNIHGMPLAAILGYGSKHLLEMFNDYNVLDPKRVAIIGLRSVDKDEKNLLVESGIHYYSMEDLDLLGINEVLNRINKDVCNTSDAIHISFDTDVLDPRDAPGVTTAVPGGLKPSHAKLAFKEILSCKKVISLDFVELNPLYDVRSQTASLIIDLLKSFVTFSP